MRTRANAPSRPWSAAAHGLRRAGTSAAAFVGSVALVGGVQLAALVPTAANADPAPAPGPVTRTTTGAYSGTVPAGVCSVQATALGGAGGAWIAGVQNVNGSGAQVKATYDVVPGQSYDGSVGGGGTQGSNVAGQNGKGGVNGGGDGGLSQNGGTPNYHHGTGGGGWTELRLAGQTAIVAGGGGGSGGGHNTTLGRGSDAGLPTGAGVTPGGTGLDGVNQSGNPGTPGGGQGGQSGGPGAGGVHSGSASLNGSGGSGRNGGAGAADPDPDAGGGGGGGYYGGGGGASSWGYGGGAATATGVGGAGGGGGASYVATDGPISTGVRDISSAAGPKRTDPGKGADGSVELRWVPCNYDLAVEKSVSPTKAAPGSTVTWTVRITNEGPDPMTQGDTVTLSDDLPGDPPRTITGISTSGGSNDVLARGTVTCSAAEGDEMTSPLECSRPYAAIGAEEQPSGGDRGLDVGETLTVTYTSRVPGPAGTETTNTASVTDRGSSDNNSANATVTAVDPPTANPDETSGPQGQPQSIDPTANDAPGDPDAPLDPDSLTLLDDSGNPTDRVEVPGQGVYTVEDGKIVFTPEPDFIGTADPVDYRIADVNGATAQSTYTPTVTPVAQPDTTSGPQGVAQSIDPLANDNVDPDVTLDPSTLTLVDGDGNPTGRVEVPGQGVYTIEDGKIVFTPEPQFTGTADPVSYQVKDSEGNTVESTYTPTLDPVAPTANPDETSGPQGQAQSTDPFANDAPGDDQVPLDRDSLTLVDGDGNPVDRVEVPGQGVYTVEDGKIVFTPEPDFIGTADPVGYRIADVNGTTAESTYTPTVTPVAQPDETSGPQGVRQSIDPLANDNVDPNVTLDPSTLTLVDEDGNPVDRVEVPGQGVYTIEDGKIVFTPEPQFTGTADPVSYQVKDSEGNTVESTYTPTLNPVTPTANPDETSGPQGVAQSIDPFGNDAPGDDQVPLERSSLTLLDGDGNPVDRVEVPGQGVYTVEDGKIVFTPEPQFTGTADPVTYRIADVNGTTAQSTYTPTLDPVTPEANPDETSGPQGQAQSTDPFANDRPGDDQVPLDRDSLTLLDGDGNPVDRVEVPGQGVYTVEDGKIVFTPEPQFTGTADPVTYRIADVNGTTAQSTYTPTLDPVTPEANPDETRGPQGVAQSADPFANDAPGDDQVPLDRDSLTLLDGDGNPTDRVEVPGQGVYTIEDGKIVFTPEPQFTGTADPVDYRIADVNGTTAQSTYTPTIDPVAPKANPDKTSGPQGQAQSTDPFANDQPGDDRVPLDRESLTLLDGAGNPTDRVVVPGQGVYTVKDGKIVFTPEPQFIGTADPVKYRIKDVNGTPAESTYTPTVTPVARPDETSGPQGQRQVIDPLANDNTDPNVQLDRSTLTLLDADGRPTTRVVVPGQGVFTVEDGMLVFTPEPQFVGKADPVRYQVKDSRGNTVGSTYTPTVTPLPPVANPDTTSGPQGKRQVIDPFANDTPGSVPLDRGSLTLLDKDGNPTNRVVIPGQGVYTIEDGKIVFTPEPQFTGTATPVRYRIKDVNGNPAESTYTPTVTPGPAPNLRLTKTANAKRVTAGQRVKYTIKVRNTGKGTARNVVVCDLLPKNVTVVARGGGKLKRGKLCFAKIPSLAPGKAKSYRITVRIDRDAPKGSQTNRATATATGIKALKASRKVVIRPKKAPTTDKTVVTG
ncbi:Ig-like domain-containing protein [Patulibacter defluvii]|uniref:Ig-like domain-containing protein n=1 Tax=Patulibacter defluvii TaxID=3095358 RepID=UPI002A75CDC1|nr:Ig-like domain-containing protein [Patulibacter sp. DM4]